MFFCLVSVFLFYLPAADNTPVGLQEDIVPTRQGFQFFECTRSLRSFLAQQMGAAQTGPVHCFVVFSQDGKKMDSRGFFADAGSIQEPDIMEGFVKCRTVKTIPSDQAMHAFQEWQKVVQVYDRHRADMYRLTHTNCCSVATEALRQIITGKEVLDVERANCSIGTKIRS